MVVLNLLRKLFLILARSLSPVGLNFGLLEDPSLSATNLLNSFLSSSSMSRVLIISSMSASSLTLPGHISPVHPPNCLTRGRLFVKETFILFIEDIASQLDFFSHFHLDLAPHLSQFNPKFSLFEVWADQVVVVYGVSC